MITPSPSSRVEKDDVKETFEIFLKRGLIVLNSKRDGEYLVKNPAIV